MYRRHMYVYKTTYDLIVVQQICSTQRIHIAIHTYISVTHIDMAPNIVMSNPQELVIGYSPKHAHIHIHTYIHTGVHTYIHTYRNTEVHTYIHTYIQKYIHT